MVTIESHLPHLIAEPVCGYHPKDPPASEPTALTALALLATGHLEPAAHAARWLQQLQSHCGSVGISADQGEPCWTTALAILVWNHLKDTKDTHDALERATNWLLAQKGTAEPRAEQIGHDSTIIGWPWVSGTHSWIEPTAWSLLALESLGHQDSDRYKDGVRMLIDRQLPRGGCNCGNTHVLGQLTLPHLQPSAMAALALHREKSQPQIQKLIAFLQQQWPSMAGVSSVSYTAMALHAVQQPPADLRDRVVAELARTFCPFGNYYRALAVLAISGDDNPLLSPSRRKGLAEERPGHRSTVSRESLGRGSD